MRLKNTGFFDSNCFLMIIIFCCFLIQFCYGKTEYYTNSNPPTLPTTTLLQNVTSSVTANVTTAISTTHSTTTTESDLTTATVRKRSPDENESTESSVSSNSNSTTETSLQTTTTQDIGNGALLYAIIAICATVIIVAICCGCICLIKMRYRFTSLRVNFYGQGGMFRRNNNNGTITSTHAANEYITHHYENEKIEFDKWEVPIIDLLIDKTTKLGSGAFASVYKGYLKGKNPLLENIGNINFALEMAENRDNEVAIKMLHSHADDESREELKKEIAFMKTLGYHPHVLAMIGCVSSIYEPLLIVEYCANGDLLTLLRRHKDYILVDPEADCPAQADFCLTIKDLLSFSWQISDGLVYLSSKNFIHRDIACRNVLITKRMVAKISDFGLCRYSQEALYTTKVGKLPIKWMAIEALKLAEFTSKSDVWSYGVLLFELFSVGDTPYPSISPSDMLDFLLQGNRLPKPELCPEELYNMMQIMWDVNPDSRPTFETIRRNLSAFLEVSSDAYGYIQVSQDYGRFYSKMEFPMKVVDEEEKPAAVAVDTVPETVIIKPAITNSKNVITQKKIKEMEEGADVKKIDNVNGKLKEDIKAAVEETDEDDCTVPLLETKQEFCRPNNNGCPPIEQLMKEYFAAKGCSSSNPNYENAKQELRSQIQNTLLNFHKQHQQQNIPIPHQQIFPFNPLFQHRQSQLQQQPQLSPPMQNPMFRPPFFRPPFQRPQQGPRQFIPPQFQNRQRFNFRQQRPQNFNDFCPPKS